MEVRKIQESEGKDRYLSKMALFELINFHNALEDAFSLHFAQYGLSWPKFNALIHLYMAGEEGLIQTELSKKLVVSRANISSLIERLEKEDLVLRTTDPSDKRVLRVRLTKRAVAHIKSFLPIHNQYIQQVMSTINQEEKEVLISLLKKITQGLESV